MSNKYDVVVLGGGPGGYAAAIRAAQLGAKVALIEKDKLGGTCLNRGCIPTKALIACTNLYEKLQKADNFGLTVKELSFDLGKIVARKNEIVAKLVKGLAGLIEKNGITVIHGQGEVLGPEKIEVKSTEHGARSIEGKLILATGSLPTPLPGVTFDGTKFLTSDDILNLTTVPEQLDIVGSGVIGLHFAMIYSALGTKVTIYEILPEILPGVDEEIVALVKRLFKRKKIELKTVTAFNPADSCGKTLICVGRHPNLTGLEKLNLEMDGRRVKVNDRLETSLANVYAVGDLVSPKQFAHVGYEQGVIAAENALGKDRRFTYDFVPYTIYTQPEIAAVGLTEKQAREKYGEIKVGKFPLGALGIAQAMGEIEGFVKFVCSTGGKILGAHIVGAEASALISAAVLALKNGITIEQFGETFQAHPSYPEGLQEAAEAVLKRALHIFN